MHCRKLLRMVEFLQDIAAYLPGLQLALHSFIRSAFGGERLGVVVLVVAQRRRKRNEKRRLPARREFETC